MKNILGIFALLPILTTEKAPWADRRLESTKTISEWDMQAQVLDDMGPRKRKRHHY